MPKKRARAPRSRFDAGLAVRREVLGVEYVDEAMRGADDFTRASGARDRVLLRQRAARGTHPPRTP
jgi:hypothetical protein